MSRFIGCKLVAVMVPIAVYVGLGSWNLERSKTDLSKFLSVLNEIKSSNISKALEKYVKDEDRALVIKRIDRTYKELDEKGLLNKTEALKIAAEYISDVSYTSLSNYKLYHDIGFWTNAYPTSKGLFPVMPNIFKYNSSDIDYDKLDAVIKAGNKDEAIQDIMFDFMEIHNMRYKIAEHLENSESLELAQEIDVLHKQPLPDASQE